MNITRKTFFRCVWLAAFVADGASEAVAIFFFSDCSVQPGSIGVVLLLLSSGTRVLKPLPDKLLIEATHDATSPRVSKQA
jgi:hypothetical protein